MATVSGITAEEMQSIANASVTSGDVDANGNLILETRGGTQIPAGNVTGPVTVGLVTMFAGPTAPAGWLLCDGTAISRTAYAVLFALIGTTYGTGDGATTFNLPNLKGKIPVGRDAAQTEFDVLGETGGEKAHLLTTAEMPAHAHIQNSHGHGTTEVAHNHTQNSHGHGTTEVAHNHTQNSHNHTQNSHGHTQDTHAHTQASHSHAPAILDGFQAYVSGGATRTRFAAGTSGAYAIQADVQTDLGFATATDSKTPVINSTTATNQSTTATNIATTATNNSALTGLDVNSTTATNNSASTGLSVNSTTPTEQNAGGGGSHNNLQPYVVMNYIIKF